MKKSIIQNYILIFILVLIGYSCNNKIKNLNYSKKINLYDSVIIKIPDTLQNFLDIIQIAKLDSNILFIGQKAVNGNSLVVYNFNDSSFKTVKFNKEGPNKIKVDSWYYSSPENIWILENFPLKIKRINEDGLILNSYNLDSIVNSDTVMYQSGVVFQSGRLRFNRFDNTLNLHIIRRDQPMNKYSNYCELKYSPYKNKAFIYGKYPEIYKTNSGVFQQKDIPLRVYNDSITIMSFEASDSLFIYNSLNGELIKRVYAGSNYIKEIKPFNIKLGFEKFRIYNRTEPGYVALLYDPINNLFFRVANHRQPKLNNKGRLNQYSDSDWSVIILNEEFSIIGETKFSGGNTMNYVVDCINGELYFVRNPNVIEGEYVLYKFKVYENN